jgi:ribosome recycling factor
LLDLEQNLIIELERIQQMSTKEIKSEKCETNQQNFNKLIINNISKRYSSSSTNLTELKSSPVNNIIHRDFLQMKYNTRLEFVKQMHQINEDSLKAIRNIKVSSIEPVNIFL